jgi:hypothetical protein
LKYIIIYIHIDDPKSQQPAYERNLNDILTQTPEGVPLRINEGIYSNIPPFCKSSNMIRKNLFSIKTKLKEPGIKDKLFAYEHIIS